MKCLTLLALATLALFANSARAELYGSQTLVTVAGTYYFEGASATKTLANGNTRDTAKHIVLPMDNLAILETMRTRSLITATEGYKLVMVGNAHMADGVQFFAIRGPNSTAVPVPADLLSLGVQNGPINGVLVIAADSSLKSLNQESHNLANLTLTGFTGYGALTQTWTSRVVVNGTVNEGVELVDADGEFSGPVSLNGKTGIGIVALTLTNAKTVDLTRFGMATTATPTTSSGGTAGTSAVTITGVAGVGNIGSGSLILNGSTSGSGVNTTSLGGTLTIGSSTNTYTTDLSLLATSIYDSSLTKSGTGSLTFSGTNTYTGATTVSAGTLQLSNSAVIGNSGSFTYTFNQSTGDLSLVSTP